MPSVGFLRRKPCDKDLWASDALRLVRESGQGRVRAQGKSRSGWAGWLQPDPAGEHWSVSSISEPETPAPVSHWLRAAFPTCRRGQSSSSRLRIVLQQESQCRCQKQGHTEAHRGRPYLSCKRVGGHVGRALTGYIPQRKVRVSNKTYRSMPSLSLVKQHLAHLQACPVRGSPLGKGLHHLFSCIPRPGTQ